MKIVKTRYYLKNNKREKLFNENVVENTHNYSNQMKYSRVKLLSPELWLYVGGRRWYTLCAEKSKLGASVLLTSYALRIFYSCRVKIYHSKVVLSKSLVGLAVLKIKFVLAN